MTMNSRVVHVCSHYPPYIGGLEKVVESLALFRHSRGLEVEVLTSVDTPSESGSSDAPFVHRLPSYEIAHTTIIPRLIPRLLRLRSDSVIHLHIAQAFLPEAVYLAHRLGKVPYVAHLHIDVGPSGAAGFLLNAYKPMVLGHVLRNADAVVVFTEEQRQLISNKYGIDRNRIEVIRNGVDEAFFYRRSRDLHPRAKLLFVGRLSGQKNLPLLLHALNGVSDRFETTFVGDGELRFQLEAMVGHLNLQNVQFHGRADGEDLLDLFRGADIFVLPSEREGMPLVLLEAMAMGLPIVATNISGNRDLVVDGTTGTLVSPIDPQEMRRALVDMATDPIGFRRMSEAALEHAAQYSWANIGEEFEQLYRRVSRDHDSFRNGLTSKDFE